MKKTTPILYREFSPNDYKREFERIDKNIQNMDDIDFEITINTDIFFFIDFDKKHKKYANCKDSYSPTFEEFKQKPLYVQKSAYSHYLKMLFMFPKRLQEN